MPDYALSTWIVKNVPADEAIAMVADAGFTAVELSSDECPLVQAWVADPPATRGRLADAGIRIASVHSPEPGRLIDVADDSRREAALQAELACFGQMHASGVPEIIIHPTSTWSLPEGDNWDAVRSRSRDSLERLAPRAADLGLRMAVENLAKEPSPAASIGGVLDLIDGLGDHVGVCQDIGHTVQAGLDLLDELDVALSSGKLFSLHLHDVDPNLRDHHVPGDGCADLDAVIAALDARNFTGGRTIEVSPPSAHPTARLSLVADVRRRWSSSP